MQLYTEIPDGTPEFAVPPAPISGKAEPAKTTAQRVKSRIVKPWTWAKVLSRQCTEDRGFLLVMHTLRTRMDDSGYAWPSQMTWAKEARYSVKTIQRATVKAEAEGWLIVSIAGRTDRGHNHLGYQ